MWRASDSIVQRGFDVNYLNPIIFYRPVEFSLGSPDNVMIGMNTSARLWKTLKIYGQLVFDEFKLDEIRGNRTWWANKYSIQLGFNYFDAFGLRNINLQGEYNLVRPFTYSHSSVAQNYGHFNESLAHPRQANFQEIVGIVNYTKGDLFVEARSILSVYGNESANDTSSTGSSIFKSSNYRERDNGYEIANFNDNVFLSLEANITYTIIPSINFQLYGIAGYRELSGYYNSNSLYVFIGAHTALFNRYRDF